MFGTETPGISLYGIRSVIAPLGPQTVKDLPAVQTRV